MAEIQPTGAPPEQMGNYRILERLGEGGMGVVYLAFDVDLGRRVALKWLLQATPASMERLRQEAHLHARVEHPAVCRVYQVGEWKGCPFLVMQLIQGQTLDKVAPALSLATKLRLMATLADGVHAAHRQGLIHRDLKPANFMVEPDEAGGWRPYVMDFGLARDERSGSLTQTGMLLGSPSYMAPEQVAGSWVDIRTDVYGLGATLFEILTGRPPFQGQAADILVQVQTQNPPRLRELQPDLPRDLETVIQTCLAKDPAHRYPSAAALRDDLQRLLDGEPVQARRVSPLERLKLWIRRNRMTSALAALVLLSLLTTVLVWEIGQRRAQTRAYWAQRFGQEAMRMDSVVRFGRMLPAHDVVHEFNQVRHRMEDVRRQMAQVPGSRGPGHFTLGQGFLLLGDTEAGRRELEIAWQLGHRSAEVSLALGHSLIDLYDREFSASLGILDPAKRSQRQAEIRRDLRDRALEHLHRARQELGAGFSMEEEARLALVDQRFDDAARLARAAHDLEPWRYDGLFYLAKALAFRGREAKEAGYDAQAKAHFEQALEVLETPGRIGPSDDRIQDVRKFVWLVGDSLKLGGLDRLASREKALAASEILHAVNSSRLDMRNSHALILTELGKARARQGQDPEPYFRRAEAVMKTILEAPAQGPGAHPPAIRTKAQERLASLAHTRAARAVNAKQDPQAWVKEGLRICDQTLAEGHAQWETHQNKALLYLDLSDYQKAMGLENLETLERSADALRDCANLNPSAASWNNLGEILNRQAERKLARGEDPRPALANAREALQKASGVAVDQPGTLGMLGDGYLLDARWAWRNQQDPTPALAHAQGLYEKAEAKDTEEAAFPAGLAMVHALCAEVRLARHGEAKPEARLALQHGQRALLLKTEQAKDVRQAMAKARQILAQR